jgi:hypothetical protein
MSTPTKASDQAKRFKEAAREAGADETGEAFKRAFAAIVPPKRRQAAPASKDKSGK